MASVDPHPTRKGWWVARGYLGRDINGRPVRPSRTYPARTRSIAERVAADWENGLKHRGVTEGGRHTVADAAASWLEACRLKERSPATLWTYEINAEKIGRAIGSKRVDTLTVADVETYYRALQAAGERVSTRHKHLSMILERARKLGWCAYNVAKDADRPSERARRGQAPTIGEAFAVIRAAHEDSPVFARLLVVALGTGMRRGELAAMRLSRLDVAGYRYTVDQSASAIVDDDGPIVKGTKSDKPRKVELGDAVMAAALQQVEWVTRRADASGVVLASDPFLWSARADCARPPHPDWFTKQFARARKRAGVSWRLHDLRHAYATFQIADGTPVTTVQGQLGHSKASTTTDFYGHAVEASARRAAERMDSELAKQLGR